MRQLPACRHSQYGVFTCAQACEGGLTRHVLQGLVNRGRLRPLRRGVYVDVDEYAALPAEAQLDARAVAVCLSSPGSVVSHHSARLIHRLPSLRPNTAKVTLTVPERAGHGGRRRDAWVYAAGLPAEDVERRLTWAVTSVAHTVCDLARCADPLDGAVAMDAALCRRLVSPRELLAVVDRCDGWPGSQRLRKAIRRVDAGAESPYETVARLHLQDARLHPIAQVWAFDRRGRIGCGDLWIPELSTFLEIDGDIKYTADADPLSLIAEKRRQERMEDAGFGVARVSAKETLRPGLLLERVTRAAARGRLARTAHPTVTGYVGPPPRWADRGAMVPLQRLRCDC